MRALRTAPHPPTNRSFGVAALAGPVSQAVEEGEVQGRDSGCGCGHCSHRLAHRCVWAFAPAGWLQFQGQQHPQRPAPRRAQFSSQRCLGRSRAGSLVCVERGWNLCLHSQSRHLEGRPPACVSMGSTFSPSVSVLGRKVAALGMPWLDTATVGTLSAYTGWKSSCY